MTRIAKLSSADKTRLALAGAGLVVGGLVGVTIARLDKAGMLNLEGLAWSDLLASLLVMLLVVTAAAMTVASFSPKAAARMMDPGAKGPATPAQASLLRQQALVVGLAGAMLAAPVVVVLLFGEAPPVVGSIVMLGILAAFLVQTVSNLAVWRRADELMRRAISETAAICFWILQALLFLWAAAEKLGLAPPLTAWDMMTVLMSFYLVVSSLVALRRGFA